MFKNEIIEWNRERGLLDNFDPELEIKMLSEESREFYKAGAFAHKLCEYADFLFVREGTMAKYHCQIGQTTASFSFGRDAFVQLMEWTEEVQDNMLACLVEAYDLEKLHDRISGFEQCVYLALSFVVENNKSKGKKTDGGKVIKIKDHIRPEVLLKEFLYDD